MRGDGGGVIPHHERDCGRPDRMLKRGIRGRRKLAVEALKWRSSPLGEALAWKRR